jgi:hypothetical protein
VVRGFFLLQVKLTHITYRFLPLNWKNIFLKLITQSSLRCCRKKGTGHGIEDERTLTQSSALASISKSTGAKKREENLIF